MGCVRQANRQEACRFFKIFVLKFLLGLTDVITDCVNGHNFFTRQFLLALYFASVTRDQFLPFENDSVPWGYSTLFLVWFPGKFLEYFLLINISSCQNSVRN